MKKPGYQTRDIAILLDIPERTIKDRLKYLGIEPYKKITKGRVKQHYYSAEQLSHVQISFELYRTLIQKRNQIVHVDFEVNENNEYTIIVESRMKYLKDESSSSQRENGKDLEV